MGSEGAVGMDLKAKLYAKPGAPMVVDFIAGLGGREVNPKTVAGIVERAEGVINSGLPLPDADWVDLNPAIVP